MVGLLIEEKPSEAAEYFSIAVSFIASLVRFLLFLPSRSRSRIVSCYPPELLPDGGAVLVCFAFDSALPSRADHCSRLRLTITAWNKGELLQIECSV